MILNIEQQEKTEQNTKKHLKMEVRNMDFYYGKFRALTDINLQVHSNMITAIIGPSGCGKSTLLRSFNRMNDLVTVSFRKSRREILLVIL